MKRRFIKLGLFLLLGAVVNVAVAWGMATWQQAHDPPKSRGARQIVRPSDDLVFRIVTIGRYVGFPNSALHTRNFGLDNDYLKSHSLAMSQGISIRIRDFGRIDTLRLPICPIWPGFAINTIFYAAILWLLFSVPGFVRRHLRLKRGLCPSCAYPIGASPVCTECGNPVNPTRVESASS